MKQKPAHPAKFSDVILAGLEQLLPAALVVDPMAGVGRIREAAPRALCLELEAPWAAQCGLPAVVADAAHLPLRSSSVPCICTSPVYGNRMSDHHNAQERCRPCGATGQVVVGRDLSGIDILEICEACGGEGVRAYERNTYRHKIGRALHPANTGQLQWGEEYRRTHLDIWWECYRVLVEGGLMVLNVSDHIRVHKRRAVSAWHVRALQDIGFALLAGYRVQTPRNRNGENRDARVPYEYVFMFQKDAA